MKTYDSRIVITAADETSIRYTSNGTPLENTREGNPLRNERFSHSNYRVLSFPPEVGKTWTFNDAWVGLDRRYRGTQKGNVAVVAYEKVQVPAGESESFKVQWTAD